MRRDGWGVTFAVVCTALLLAPALGGVVVQGTLKGGEIAKGRWKPAASWFQPALDKVEDKVPDEAKKGLHGLRNTLEHIQVPGATWNLMVDAACADACEHCRNRRAF